MDRCTCDIKNLLSIGHDAGCPESKTTKARAKRTDKNPHAFGARARVYVDGNEISFYTCSYATNF